MELHGEAADGELPCLRIQSECSSREEEGEELMQFTVTGKRIWEDPPDEEEERAWRDYYDRKRRQS
jgi:limonene-1,2-epoxide hydrolase